MVTEDNERGLQERAKEAIISLNKAEALKSPNKHHQK